MFSIKENDGNIDYQINMIFNKHDINRSCCFREKTL